MTRRFIDPDLWANREFKAFVLANSIEHFAASALTIMLAFHIYDARKSALDIALLGVVQVIPALTLALHGGEMADRRSRRKLVLVTVLMLSVVCAALVMVSLAGTLLVPTLLAAAFLSATARAYQQPAAVGLEAQVLPANLVLKGVPIVSTSARISDMVGPVAMGFAWAAWGPAPTYFILGGLFIVSWTIFAFYIAEKAVPTIVSGGGSAQANRRGCALCRHQSGSGRLHGA